MVPEKRENAPVFQNNRGKQGITGGDGFESSRPSRSTWYRRQKKARKQAAAALAVMTRQAALDRLEWQITQLRADLEKAARFADEGAAILAELAAVATRPHASL
jgi:hypothetical protein